LGCHRSHTGGQTRERGHRGGSEIDCGPIVRLRLLASCASRFRHMENWSASDMKPGRSWRSF
jgi:hypothetical protein